MRAYVEQQRKRFFAAEARRQSRLLAERAADAGSDEAEVMAGSRTWPTLTGGRLEAGRPADGRDLGDYGKPRPALIVHSDVHAEHPSITVLPLTSELHDMPLLRITVEPGKNTGLRRQ